MLIVLYCTSNVEADKPCQVRRCTVSKNALWRSCCILRTGLINSPPPWPASGLQWSCSWLIVGITCSLLLYSPATSVDVKGNLPSSKRVTILVRLHLSGLPAGWASDGFNLSNLVSWACWTSWKRSYLLKISWSPHLETERTKPILTVYCVLVWSVSIIPFQIAPLSLADQNLSKANCAHDFLLYVWSIWRQVFLILGHKSCLPSLSLGAIFTAPSLLVRTRFLPAMRQF